MTTIAFTAGDAAYWGLAIFLVAIGLAAAFMLFRLGQSFERLSSFIKGTERDLLPVIVKTGATVDRVNYQLDKADTVTDSAVSMADSADTAVRAISTVIATPVEKISGLAAGVTHGFSQFRKSKNFGEASSVARDAARQREADLHDDLRNAGRTPMETERPAAQPRPEEQSKPDLWPRPEPVPKPPPAPVPPDEPAPAPKPAPKPAPTPAPTSAPPDEPTAA
jgi:outer membrane biosynthesis protein TonB